MQCVTLVRTNFPFSTNSSLLSDVSVLEAGQGGQIVSPSRPFSGLLFPLDKLLDMHGVWRLDVSFSLNKH